MVDIRRDSCLIDGEWVKGQASMPVLNPADDSIVGEVPVLDASQVEAAIAAASRALPSWQARPASERAAILHRYNDLILAHEGELAALLTAEQGKPLAEALGEIRYAASFIRWFAEEAVRTYGDVIPAQQPGTRIVVLKQPVGVVAAITPWNFPAAMVTRKVGPALAAGCTIIVKPAEQTPLTALALAALGEAAGLPKGVLNVVTGNARVIGPVLTTSPVVRKLTFTGSTEVGALLYEQSAPTIKKLSLELGGNAPFVVFDDASLEEAVAGAIQSKFRNAGQTCVCADRFIVQGGIHDRFVQALAEAAGKLTVGRGDDAASQIGPLIDDDAAAKVAARVAAAVEQGAKVASGGFAVSGGPRYYAPTVLSEVRRDMELWASENFGPLAPVIRFETEEEAIALANDTPYGLAGYLYTNDARRLWRVAERMECGMIGVNTGMISTAVAPFGGIKQSGLGREGSHYGLDDYLELKTITLAA